MANSAENTELACYEGRLQRVAIRPPGTLTHLPPSAVLATA
jgi:hypothetical protein